MLLLLLQLRSNSRCSSNLQSFLALDLFKTNRLTVFWMSFGRLFLEAEYAGVHAGHVLALISELFTDWDLPSDCSDGSVLKTDAP